MWRNKHSAYITGTGVKRNKIPVFFFSVSKTVKPRIKLESQWMVKEIEFGAQISTLTCQI